MNHKHLPALLAAAGIVTPDQAALLADLLAADEAGAWGFASTVEVRAQYVTDPEVLTHA